MFSNHLKVAVGVISRRNQILISQRAKDVHQGDLWEFPGGKLNSGEESFQALYRELNEELGISIGHAEPMICIPYTYPASIENEKPVSVLLDVWSVPIFTGRPVAKEKQPLRWVNIEQLELFSFPKANKNIINAIHLPDTYFITPECDVDSEVEVQAYLQRFRTICQQGINLIQLRFKKNINSNFLRELLQIISAYQIKVQINSSLLTRVDELNLLDKLSHQLGVHLTSSDLNCPENQKNIKKYKGYLSASCHELNDILRANELELDFIVISPVTETTSHPNKKAIGWEEFKVLTQHAQMPVFALGGMNFEDMLQSKQCGAQGIAAISSLWDSPEL